MSLHLTVFAVRHVWPPGHRRAAEEDAGVLELLPDLDPEGFRLPSFDPDVRSVMQPVAYIRTSQGSRDFLAAVGAAEGFLIPKNRLLDVRTHAALMELDERCAEGLSGLWRYARAGFQLYALDAS